MILTRCAYIVRSLIAFSALLISLSHSLCAQDHWAQDIGGPGNDLTNDLVVDPQGYIYVTGEFSGNAEADGIWIGSNGSLDMFLAKYNASGNLQWIRSFGSIGIDRGRSIDIAVDGNIVVAGQFMGTVDFDGTVVQSSNGTADVFVAKFAPNNGSLVWIAQGGGNLGSDHPNAVDASPDGSITVVGEFRGQVDFSGAALTSMINPITQLPDLDIFIAHYSATGQLLWLEHGAAKYADRAMAVEHDPLGNIFVSGQFSDTITFDQTHVNQTFSAVFLVKFDPVGTELGFSYCAGGNYNQVHDMVLSSNNELLLTGDIEGNPIFFDNSLTFITSASLYNSFVFKIDLDGQLLDYTLIGSEHELTTRAVAANDSIVSIFGRFECQFDELRSIYGASSWLATGELGDLYIARFSMDSLAYIDAQQFGGQQDKLPRSIQYMPSDELIFCGSYHHRLYFPADLDFEAELGPNGTWVYSANYGISYCGDSLYGIYGGLKGNGFNEGFLATGFTEGRAPYDVFARDTGNCNLVENEIDFNFYNPYNSGYWQGPDTIVACGYIDLFVDPNMAVYPDTNSFYVGPTLNYSWSNGSDLNTIMIDQSGWYNVHVESRAGCYEAYDTVYVHIDPMPTDPTVSDDQGVNNMSNPGNPIYVCFPIVPTIWAHGLDTNNIFYWDTPYGTVYNDTVVGSQDGLYTIHHITPEGCEFTTSVNVITLYTDSIPSYTADLWLSFPMDVDNNDTIWLCQNSGLSLLAEYQLYLNGQPVNLPSGLSGIHDLLGYFSNSVYFWDNSISPGWYYADHEMYILNTPCGSDSLNLGVSLLDSVYIEIFPMLNANAQIISAPDIMCIGDTALLIGACTNCTSSAWSGPGIINTQGDSIWVTLAGQYTYQASWQDTNNCSTSDWENHNINYPISPILQFLPSDGIICPNSDALIYTTLPALQYEWYGPLGFIPGNNDSIVVTTPGEYFLAMTDVNGCFLTSDPVLLTEYATPYLNVLPDGVICDENDVVTLEVVTTGYSSLVWLPPLSGNSLTQTITQAGTYSAEVSACGITTTVTAVVTESMVDAEIDLPGPFDICEGDSVILSAVQLGNLNLWLPFNTLGDQITVTESGAYTLISIDPSGCSDTSATVIVEVYEYAQPLSILNDEICEGEDALLQASGSGSIIWFIDPQLTIPFDTTNMVQLLNVLSDTSFYVIQAEAGCESHPQVANVVVNPLPGGTLIDGPPLLCLGTDLTLDATSTAGSNLEWNTPQGVFIGSSIFIPNVSFSDSGLYTVTPTLNGCVGQSVNFNLLVVPADTFSLGPDTTFCIGDIFTLYAPPWLNNVLWSDGSNGPTLDVIVSGTYTIEGHDPNGCFANDLIELAAIDCGLPDPPNVITPNGDGHNDHWSIEDFGYTGLFVDIYNRWGQKVWEGDPSKDPWRGEHFKTLKELPEGVYYFTLKIYSAVEEPKSMAGYIQLMR